MIQQDTWGNRLRIGILVPHNDIVPESEFSTMAPEGVSVHAMRVPFAWRGEGRPTPLGLDAVRAFVEPPHLDEAAALLADAPVKVIMFAFTSSSFVLGPKGDTALAARLELRTGGIPILIACASAVPALRALNVKKLAVVDPPWFTPALDRLGAAYFGDQGFDVVYAQAAELAAGQLTVQPADVYDWVRSHVPDMAEAVFIGGNGFRVVAAIDAMEQVLGRPVISANQASLWHGLRIANVQVPVVNYGRIFAQPLGSLTSPPA